MNQILLDNYQVRKTYECPSCGGFGVLPGPDWESFRMERSVDENLEATDYFRARGYESPPPEEVRCDRCQGEGILSEFVPFQEAIQAWRHQRRVRLLNLLSGVATVLQEAGLDDEDFKPLLTALLRLVGGDES